ncbi:MAG: restriction endonuclease subunit S, partial [archaeon]
FIDNEINNENFKTILEPYDLVFTKIGAFIGDVAILPPKYNQYNFSQNVAGAKLIDKNSGPFYLAFFLSKFGKDQVLRSQMLSGQGKLELADVRNYKIINVSADFKKLIKNFIDSSFDCIDRSSDLFKQSEDKIKEFLNLQNFVPSIENTSVKTFNDFLLSNRLDAEYYQPKFDELEDALAFFELIRFSKLVSHPVTSGSTPRAGDHNYYTDAENGVPFIRAVDIVDGRISTLDFNYITSEVHNTILKKTQLKQNDVLFSIAGTVGRCGLFEFDFEANINQACAIIRFNEDIIMRDYFIAFFNSSIGKLLVEKYSRHGVQTNLNLDELSNLYIPILPMEQQKEIASLISSSIRLRNESKNFLEIAKQAVEIAIEKDERTASAWLLAKNLNII